MNLYTRAALAINQNCQYRIERLNSSLPAILQAEKLAESLTAAGVMTEARYDVKAGVNLQAAVSIDQLPNAINTLHAEAAKVGRTVVNERNTRFVLVPTDHADTETKIIDLTIEEI
ncbi:hypothetical protein JW897_17890 [Chromobacterium alkanivorans]|uniref:hypothetical protein n=1 Tax=Chromobacterium alkanivorans TaxID=1071719 RepID=UPI0019681A70|nr:hypothetical protein [Chromobacterium alkanivorans]MBN3005608.1 hypothetical protein [Chromobacterium alkanivorans]